MKDEFRVSAGFVGLKPWPGKSTAMEIDYGWNRLQERENFLARMIKYLEGLCQ